MVSSPTATRSSASVATSKAGPHGPTRRAPSGAPVVVPGATSSKRDGCRLSGHNLYGGTTAPGGWTPRTARDAVAPAEGSRPAGGRPGRPVSMSRRPRTEQRKDAGDRRERRRSDASHRDDRGRRDAMRYRGTVTRSRLRRVPARRVGARGGPCRCPGGREPSSARTQATGGSAGGAMHRIVTTEDAAMRCVIGRPGRDQGPPRAPTRRGTALRPGGRRAETPRGPRSDRRRSRAHSRGRRSRGPAGRSVRSSGP